MRWSASSACQPRKESPTESGHIELVRKDCIKFIANDPANTMLKIPSLLQITPALALLFSHPIHAADESAKPQVEEAAADEDEDAAEASEGADEEEMDEPEDGAEAKKDDAKKAEAPKENALLAKALANMVKLKTFHVEATIGPANAKASIVGDFGESSFSLSITDPKGAVKQRRVVDGKFYLSSDAGKTWATDDKAEREATEFIFNVLTAPMQMGKQITADEVFTATEEELKSEKVLHLKRAAKDKEPATDFWLCREPDLATEGDEKPIYLRKLEMVVGADDGEFPLTSTYSKLGKPVTIKAPEPAKP